MGSRGLSANWRDGTIHSRTYHGVGTHYRPPDAHQAQEVYAIPSSHYLSDLLDRDTARQPPRDYVQAHLKRKSPRRSFQLPRVLHAELSTCCLRGR